MNRKTRFSGLHPYPAMIADELAQAIASKLVRPGATVLDPFCGTARTLFAASHVDALRIGVDVNPLPLLVAEAKACQIDLPRLEHIFQTMAPSAFSKFYELECGRKTQWFSSKAKRELSELITWLNRQRLPREVLVQLSAILSATAREVSFCRNHQWKLHRMALEDRRGFHISAWSVFAKRLKRFIEEARTAPQLNGEYRFYHADARDLSHALKAQGESLKVDVVITSPPYGDSRTTLGYGGMSSICLGVLQHVKDLNLSFVPAGQIDGLCLGGRPEVRRSAELDITKYWAGGKMNPARKRVERYLSDLRDVCSEVATVVAANASIVFVVARRSVANRRLQLEEFVCDTMRSFGFNLSSHEIRLLNKRGPRTVNSKGASDGVRRVATMREEFVLTLRR